MEEESVAHRIKRALVKKFSLEIYIFLHKQLVVINYLRLRSNKYWNKTYRYGCVLAVDLDLSMEQG